MPRPSSCPCPLFLRLYPRPLSPINKVFAILLKWAATAFARMGRIYPKQQKVKNVPVALCGSRLPWRFGSEVSGQAWGLGTTGRQWEEGPFAQAPKHAAATKWTETSVSSGRGKKLVLLIVTENSFLHGRHQGEARLSYSFVFHR